MIGPGAMNVFCAACDTRLRTRFDTNGMGATLELVEPCPKCIRERSAVVVTRGPEYTVRHGDCDRCGNGFEWAKPGVLPAECPPCQEKPKVRTGECQKCGGAFEWTRPGTLPHWCPDCNKRRKAPKVNRGPCRQCGETVTVRGARMRKHCNRCEREKRLTCGHYVKRKRSRGPYPKTCGDCERRTE